MLQGQRFLARDVIYTSSAYAMMSVSVRLSVRIAAARAARRAACGRIISRHASQC